MPKRKRQAPWLILFAIVIIVLVVASVLAQSYLFNSPATSPLVSSSPVVSPLVTSYPASDVQPAILGYLMIGSKETKVFLVSATATYATYPVDLKLQWRNETVVHKGEPCFILNLTLRNDYALNGDTAPAQKIPETNYTGSMWMTISVALFDKEGNRITATDITHADVPIPIADEFSIRSGESEAVDVVLATSNRNIDHYSIKLGYLGVIPFP